MQADIISLANYQPKDRAIETVFMLTCAVLRLQEMDRGTLRFVVHDMDGNQITARQAIARVIIALDKVLEGL